MKLLFIVLFALGISQILQAQTLQKLSFTPVEEAPQMIEREKAVIYIRSVVPEIFINSTNPDYTFRKVTGKDGEFVLRMNPHESYVISIGANGYLATVPKRIVLKLREVQVWEVTVGGSAPLEFIPVNFIVNTEGVKLSIDGQEMDGLTNLQVSIGTHNIEISKPGYATIRETIEVTSQKSLFQFTMKQVDLVGITLRSEPKGATIFLDGMDIGKSPVSLFRYPGRYEIRFELNEYITLDEVIVIPPDSTTFSKKVELVKNSGFVNISVNPSDATLLLGNNAVKNGLNEVLPGNYFLKASKSGYLTTTDSVKIELGKTVSKNIQLIKNATVLSWGLNPTNASVLINKQDYSRVKSAELAPGTYLVEIAAPGFDPISETIILERGVPVTKSWTLTQQTGSFRFLSNPADAKAKLTQNGKEISSWNGIKLEKALPIGEYELLVTMNNFRPQKRSILIEQNKETEVIVTLEEVPALELLEKKGGIGSTFQAIIFPGWGWSAVNGGEKSGKWITISSLALLGTAYIAETRSQSLYLDYQKEPDLVKSDELYSSANQWRQTALMVAGAGVSVWVYNVVKVAIKGSQNDKLKRQLKEERKLSTTLSPTWNGLALTVNF